VTIARVLIVAGSDSGGGAGIQADTKAVTMLGGHAMTAITALTAQNTVGVQGVLPVPPEFVVQQMRSCIDDIGVDAVKIGMIGAAPVAHAVADVLEGIDAPVVFDPVMIATSGAVLADSSTIAAFGRLMRMARVVTPNAPELAALSAMPVRSEGDALAAAARLAASTGSAILAKGGHLTPEDAERPLSSAARQTDLVADRLVRPDGTETVWAGPRIVTTHTHGTGCTLASGIAEGLGRGLTLGDAIARARAFVRSALEHAPCLGRGHGPIGHTLARHPFDELAG